MKLQTVVFVAMLWCIQALAILPLGAQLTAWHYPIVDATSAYLSNQPNNGDKIRLKPDGVNQEPGWALDQIGEKYSTNTTTPIYSYPDTTTPVRLYLIDTGVIDPTVNVATAYPNLKSLEIINLSGEPSVPRAHGTQMLSLIAGENTGIASGTPIHVVNYDIYSESPADADPTTDVTSLAEAISEAVEHSKFPDTISMRSVICIATSSNSLGKRYVIDRAIDSALAAGIPVIISAGNLGQDAAGFTPPSNGTKNGVICVGASDGNGTIIADSNHGVAVDILAPGYQVDTLDGINALPVPMTGTSPATALVAGAVLAKLSASPTFTPAGIESSLKAAAQAMPSGPRVLRSIVAPSSEFAPPDVVPDGLLAGSISLGQETTSVQTSSSVQKSLSVPAPAAAPALPALDSDSDGIPDIVETFHGSPHGVPPSPVLSLDTNHQIQFKFPIDQDLLGSEIVGGSLVLRNGYSWKIRCSTDFSNWSIPTGSLSKSTDAQGQAWLTASFPAGTQPSCFARIEVIAP